ncbi:hypothetical protein ACFV1L_09655 [Kitasatospora sp. NPDC059646]|uniref:WXG100-like domain-containing protein n=1 Tax=Kitasatospora sp. NPDC059646 TaxID=3346893 RepID=UPI0036A0430B
MAVELPEPLQWVLLLLAGCRWPEADEDQLRDMADHCRKTADGLKDAAQAGDATIKRALEGQQGVAAEALGKYWEKYSVGKGTPEEPGYLPGAINALNGMGDMLEQMANSAETAKIQIIAQLGILAFELATAEAEAPFTAGASMLEVPAFIAATRATVMATLKTLLKEMLVMAAKQAAQMGAINLLAQGIELAEGHRKSIDMKEVGQNALGGAVGGASAHLIGKGIGKAGEKLGVEAALKTTGGKMATGAAIGVGADVSTQLITTGKVDGESLLGSGLSGGAGAGLHAGASAAKGHFATPKAAEGPKLPGAGEHGGQDGPPTFNKSDSPAGASAYHGPSGSSTTGGSSGTPHTADAGTSIGAGSHSTGSGTGESKVNGLTPFGAGRSADSPSIGAQSTGRTATPSHDATPAPAAATHQQAASPTHETLPRQEAAAPTRETATPRTEAQPAAPVHESVPRQEAAAPAHETLPRQDVAAPVHESVPRQEATAAAHETLPRQEAATPVHESVPRQNVAAPVHESMPRQEATVPAHETLPRQEAAAPVHESVPRQDVAAPVHESMPRQEATAPAHETLPRQEASAPAHESVSRQETVAPAHEAVTPRTEPQQPAGQTHESVPRQESVAAQPHAAAPVPAHESVPVAPLHESAPRQESVAAVHDPAQPPAAPPARESVSRQEPVNPTVPQESSPVRESVVQGDAQAARPTGAGGMPNLSGVLGGGGTHLDGGTRLSAGPAAPRPTAGPEHVPGQIGPDGAGEVPAAASATQNPTAGGFTPGPVGGAGGHGGAGASGHAAPSSAVPRQGRDGQAVTGPNRTGAVPAPAGGTIRPGAGRVSESGAGTPSRNPGEANPATSRPVSEQAHDRLLERQRQEREAELRGLGEKPSVRDAVDQLGGRQRPVATRPVDADRLRQDLPGMTPHERAQEIANLKPENRRWLARDPQFVDSLKSTLPPEDFARTAAQLIVHVDPRAEQAASARLEAQQQVARMLQHPDTAARLLKNGADVVIVPKDVRMTDVPDLHGLAGAHNTSEAGGGRGYDDMRGSGGRHSAVTEENLLGEHTSVGNDPHYQDGYSTTTHEFSHTVHRFGLEEHDQKLITDAFAKKSKDPKAQWPDGPLRGANGEKNYSARDEQEYFAQVTNAYLGTNHGTDPFTGHPRNNGEAWVRKNEPELLPLLEKLYGGKPAAIHEGRANPVHRTAAENAAYDGFREFMDHVDGNGATAAAGHQPPAAEHRPPAESRPQRAGTPNEDLPAPPPPSHSNAAQGSSGQASHTPDGDYEHKIDGQKTFDTIESFLGHSPEFQQVRADLETYARADLESGDTNAILNQYRNEKLQHVDVVSRANARLDEQLRAVEVELRKGNHQPDRLAELQEQHGRLETAKAAMREQRDRLAIFEHERIKDADPARPDLADRLRARQEAELRVLPDTIQRIRAEEAANDKLLAQAEQRKTDAEAAGTASGVHDKRIADLELRKETLQKDREAREQALQDADAAIQQNAPHPTGGTRPGGVSAPAKKADWTLFDRAYREAYAYSDHGVMSQQPHAEKVTERMLKNDVKLERAVANRNHVIADYMVHKYVTAAVFKARAMDEGSHRAASDAFGDFVTAMAPDRHRIYDSFGKKAEARLAVGLPEEAVLARRDLTATPDTVDLKATYGSDRLPEAFETHGITDRTSADEAAANLERELGRPGLDVFARPELDRLAAAVAKVDPHAPSGDQLAAVHDAMGAVRQKVNERAVDDLALVNGVTGPQKLDDASAVLRAVADGRHGPLTPPQQKRLAGQLDDLAGHLQNARKDPKALRDLAADLRTRPDLATPDRYRSAAEQLANDRAALRKHEIDQRLSELADPAKGTKRPVTVAGDELKAAEEAVATRKNDIATYEKELADANDLHDAAKQKAEDSAKAAKGSTDQAKKDEAKKDAKAAREARAAAGKLRDKLDEARAKLPGDERDVLTAKAVDDRVTELYDKEIADTAAAKGKPVSKLTAKDKTVAARVAWARADVELVGQQYGGAFARAGAGENHPAAMFDRALTAKVEDVPALIEQITAGLSNSGSNLRFGDELVNKWIQNYLDPHVIRDPDLLTAVAHEQLPPEVLYAPHTADLLQAVRSLEANGLVPPELRDIMAPKTQDDLEQLVTANKLSPSAEIVTDDLGVPSPHAGKLPVSSSGDHTARAGAAKLTDDQLARLAPEGLYQPDRVPQPTSPAQPHPQPTPDQDVEMTDAGPHDAPTATVHTPDGDVQMHDGTADAGRPGLKRRREDSDSDSDGEPGPSTVRRRLAGLDLNGPTPPPPPPPPATTGHGFGAPATGHRPPPPPPAAHDGASGAVSQTPVHGQPSHDAPSPAEHVTDRDSEPMDVDTPPAARPHTPPVEHVAGRDGEPMDVETPPAAIGQTPPVEQVAGRDGEPMDIETPPTEHIAGRDGEPMDVETPPAAGAHTPPVEHSTAQGDEAATPQPQPRNDRKRGREDEEVTLRRETDPAVQDGRDAKRQRTPAYENSEAVMHDRGYQAVGPQHELTGRLIEYLGGAPKVHPPMSNLLLHQVNPHQSPVRPAEGFRPGDDLKACLENVEAYRDTHFGRPRVSGQTVHGTVEPIPGDVLWKRHDPPARFGEGPDALRQLIDTVKSGGRGSFATVLGAGPTGAGHAVALVHDRDGNVRWADLTERKVYPAVSWQTPPGFRPEWTVWASVAGPREDNISGTPDPAFMERYSTLVRAEPRDTSEPMDIDDGFGGSSRPGADVPPRTEVLEEHRGGTPKDGTPQNDATPQPDVPPQTDRTAPGGGRSELPQTGPVGGASRPRSASAPAELGPRTVTPGRSETVTEPRESLRSPSPAEAEHTAPRTPKSEQPAGAEFPPPGPRVPVAGDGYCLLRSVAVGAPELTGPRTAGAEDPAQRLQTAVGDHFRALRPDEWPTEVVANYRGTLLSRPDLRAEDLLNYLPAQDREAFTGLSVEQLRDSVGRHLTDNPPPPTAHEREALLRTVQGWDTRWRSTEGEMLPAATAHALGLRLRVVDHDGITQAVFGPSDGRPVTVYRQSDHYDGSEPPPVTATTEHTPTEPNPAPRTEQTPDLKPEAELKPGLESKPEPPTAPEAEPEFGAEREVGVKSPAEAELKPGPESKPEPPTGPEAKPESKPEVRPEAEVKPEPQSKSEPPTESEPKPEAEPESRPEAEFKSEPESKSEPEPKPQPEAVAPRPIAGTDLVVGLTGHEVAVREKVIDVLARAVPGDRAAARAFADAYFGPATLRPMLGALSRGEVWTAPFEGNGWSGSVQLRGSVTESTYLRTDKIEFENGADRTVATGTNRDAQWQFNVGAQARHGRGIGEPSELVAYYHDRGHGEVNLDLGGMVARSKTNEPAKVFRSTMRLELDFGDLRHQGAPVRGEAAGRTEAVDVDLTVAVPVRDGGTAAGELRVPPQRLLDGRVGGQEIVLDLAPRGTSGNRPPVAALLDHVEAAARQEFGGDWPALREKVLAEVDFARLQRDVKSMTAGEPVSVTLTDRRGRPLGTVDITARVGELKQSGTTKETEFNIGTTVQQVRSTSSNRGNAGQFGFSAAVKPGTGLIGGGGAGRLGRDHVEISGDARTSQLTSKSKVPGVLYDGTVHFELSFNGKNVAHDAGTADIRLLVDRADTTAPPVTPDGGTAEPAGAKPAEPAGAEPELHEVAGPPQSVWHGGDDRGGLGETVVVRDVESTAALREALDAKGRERFGDDWNAVRDQVMQGFSQPNLAARLTGMTRGEALEVKVPGKEGLVVTAVARVESMTYRREDGKAELNTVNETSSFAVDRRLGARTTIEQGQVGGTAAKGTPGVDLVAAGSGQQRQRVGGQGRQADRVYANGKYGAPQAIYGAELRVDLHVGRPGEAPGAGPDVSAPLRVEVGLDARDTVKVQAPRSEDGSVAFRRPERKPQAEPKPASTEPATHTAPRRMRERHELNASYVVHTLSGADQVRTVVEDAVRTKYGEPSEEVKQRIGASFDRIALKAQLSQLTRGGRITETVSGKTWSAEVTVTARLGESTFHSRTDKYEFESGTRTSSGQGAVRDHRNRTDGGGQLKVKAPFVDVTGGYAYRVDRSYGQSAETVGSASNRGKHVEPAVLFDVAAPYDVTVTFKRLNVPDGSHTATVDTVARVAVPMRDADPVAGPVERTTAKQPKGFVEGRRLDSSAIVTDVHALPNAAENNGSSTGRRMFGESVLSQVESGWKPGGLRLPGGKAPGQQKLERNPFDSDWAGIRRKLDAELTPDRLQSRLKGMTAGDEIVVRHGRTTVRVGAVLRDRMEHLGDSGTTEFNAGTDVQRSFARTDGTGTNHQGTLGAVASVPVPAAPGVSVTGGLTGTGGRGHDRVDVQTRSTAAGSATKAKLPGSAYAGEAELQFTITRRPWIGAQVHQRRTAAIGFESLVETGETVPVPSKSGTAAGSDGASESGAAAASDGASRTVTVRPPEPVTVQVPPERVWESGLRDTDVLRWLGDVGGVQDLVRLRGPEYFGASAWQELAPVVGTVTSHSHLSALFGTATQGAEVAASVPSRRVTLGGGKGVEVGVKVVSLEHRAVDDKVELSPANGTTAGSTRYDLAAKNAGVQGQLGAKITGDVTNSPGIVGGAQHLWRDGGGHGDSGQVVSNGKFATPMARYAGHAEVEVTLFDGSRNPVKEKGIVPFAVDIPLSETTGSQIPGDHYLAFTGEHQGGELRVTEGGWRLEEVHRVVSPDADGPSGPAARSRAEHEQLIGTVRLGRAVFEREFTAGTEEGAARIRATHRLVELGGGTSAGTSALLGELLGTPDGEPVRADQVRRVIDWVGRRSADGPVGRDDLAAGARSGWAGPEESA